MKIQSDVMFETVKYCFDDIDPRAFNLTLIIKLVINNFSEKQEEHYINFFPRRQKNVVGKRNFKLFPSNLTVVNHVPAVEKLQLSLFDCINFCFETCVTANAQPYSNGKLL